MDKEKASMTFKPLKSQSVLTPSVSLPNPVSKLEGITGSGSFQSHLSTTNSQQRRLRSASLYVTTPDDNLPNETEDVFMPNPTRNFSPTTKFASFFHATFPLENPAFVPTESHPVRRIRSWPLIWLKWTAFVYCSLCVVFMSVTIYKWIRPVAKLRVDHTTDDPKAQVFTDTLPVHLKSESTPQWLSQILPMQYTLDPFISRGISALDDFDITACIWSDSIAILDMLTGWASKWPGPISLLITTTVKRMSPAHEELLERLRSLVNRPALASVSLHLFHVDAATKESANMYLNLARLFAPTRVSVIFPGNISATPPAKFYESLLPRSRTIHRPSVLTEGSIATFPFPPLSPVFIPRDHPLWCNERSFLSSSRTSDWDECLWQLWVDGFGKVDQVNVTTEWAQGNTVHALSPTEIRVRNRLKANYRTETCELATRQLALQTVGHKSSKRKVLWLRHFCHQTAETADIKNLQ